MRLHWKSTSEMHKLVHWIRSFVDREKHNNINKEMQNKNHEDTTQAAAMLYSVMADKSLLEFNR